MKYSRVKTPPQSLGENLSVICNRLFSKSRLVTHCLWEPSGEGYLQQGIDLGRCSF
jgi:hypothetical protein